MADPGKGLVFEPRDPIVVRDGRALEGTNAMRNVAFPWPSSVAGCVRTALGPLGGGTDWSPNRQVPVCGPWLVHHTSAGWQPLFPAPRDCFWQANPGQPPRRWRLRPSSAAATTDLGSSLQLVTPDWAGGRVQKGKPPRGLPGWWYAKALYSWLTRPTSGEVFDKSTRVREIGPENPIRTEERTHVHISSASRTAAEGDLFSTEGARFNGSMSHRYGLGATVAHAQRATIVQRRIVKLGGEGRISRVAASDTVLPDFGRVRGALVNATRIRVILLTPGIFSRGALPDRIEEVFGPGATIRAACVDRPEVISGWDMATNKPKGTRRMAKAGSVYWIDGVDPSRLEGAWMDSLCGDAQDRCDGFGRILLGVE